MLADDRIVLSKLQLFSRGSRVLLSYVVKPGTGRAYQPDQYRVGLGHPWLTFCKSDPQALGVYWQDTRERACVKGPLARALPDHRIPVQNAGVQTGIADQPASDSAFYR